MKYFGILLIWEQLFFFFLFFTFIQNFSSNCINFSHANLFLDPHIHLSFYLYCELKLIFNLKPLVRHKFEKSKWKWHVKPLLKNLYFFLSTFSFCSYLFFSFVYSCFCLLHHHFRWSIYSNEPLFSRYILIY